MNFRISSLLCNLGGQILGSPLVSCMAEKTGLEAGDDNARIPQDLLIEILARVPVKSLIRFTCVCKSWLSLIKSPEFAAKQYETRTRLLLKAPYDCDKLVLRYGGYFVKRVEVLFLDYATLDVSTVFQCKPVKDHYDYFNDCSLYGPCKGIFCVDINIDLKEPALLLWNPSTGEVFRPAKPKSKLGGCLGFGFDDNTNDFKIVTFKGHKGFPRRVKVYSLTRNTWRDVKVYDYGACKDFSIFSCFEKRKDCSIGSSSTPSNGRMCNWLAYDKTYGRRFLLSFDFVDEVFIETPIPNDITKDCCDLVQQLYHHTYPALFAYCVETRIGRARVPCVDVWVLTEYGPGGSWTKHLSVTLPDQINVPEPSGISKDEGMLLKRFNNDKLVYYEPVNQQIKYLNVSAREVFGYTESLFSIKSYRQQLRGSDDYDEEMPYCFCEVDSPCFEYRSCLY